jgi:hypothetical protein
MVDDRLMTWAEERTRMALPKAYEELVDFIAAETNPQNLVAFRPSEAARERVWDLVAREKTGELTPQETTELGHYLQLEHIMRMAKARAQRYLRGAAR